MKKIEELPNSGIMVLLMRRTGNHSVRTSVGCRDAFGEILFWRGARSPTHYTDLPPFPKAHD